MEKYEALVMEILEFEPEDIICTSCTIDSCSVDTSCPSDSGGTCIYESNG